MKIKGLRWWIITLIGLATVINYIDRSAINVMWPYIYKEFGIADVDSKKALALITSCFMVAYALGQAATGKLMDAIGTRLGMAFSIIGWSISIALHSLARSIASFSIFRMLLGFSEAGNWPGAAKSNAEWFPARERGIAQGIFGAGAALGSVVALPFIAGLYLRFGWRATFACIAVLGVLWVLPWLAVNKAHPSQHPWITDEEKEHVLDRVGRQSSSVAIRVYSLRELLKFGDTWSILLSRFFIDPVWWMFVTWLPTFLNEQYHFDVKKVGAYGWLPYLFAAIGGLLGGLYASLRIRSGITPSRARKEAISIGSAIMLAALVATALNLDSLKENINMTLALISATLFGFQFLINNTQTLPADYFHGKNVGTIAGLGGTAAVVGTLITIWMVPYITRVSYVPFFVMGAIVVPLSWICIMFIKTKKRIDPEQVILENNQTILN